MTCWRTTVRKSLEPGNGLHDRRGHDHSWPHGKGEGAGRTGPKCFPTSGEVLSKPLRALVALPRAGSCILGSGVYIAPHTGCQSWGWMQRKLLVPRGGRGTCRRHLSPTLSSRSSFPRNPLDAKMGIPGNTVLEVMA